MGGFQERFRPGSSEWKSTRKTLFATSMSAASDRNGHQADNSPCRTDMSKAACSARRRMGDRRSRFSPLRKRRGLGRRWTCTCVSRGQSGWGPPSPSKALSLKRRRRAPSWKPAFALRRRSWPPSRRGLGVWSKADGRGLLSSTPDRASRLLPVRLPPRARDRLLRGAPE